MPQLLAALVDLRGLPGARLHAYVAYGLPAPAVAGVDGVALEKLFARVEREVVEGRVEGCQVAVCRRGLLAGMRSFGRGGGRPITDDSLFCCWS